MNPLAHVIATFQPILEYASYEQPETLVQVYDALSLLQTQRTLVHTRDSLLLVQKLTEMTSDLTQTTREHLNECIDFFVHLLWSLNGAQSVFLQFLGQTKKVLVRFPVEFEDIEKRFSELFKIRVSEEFSLQVRDTANGVWYDLENSRDIRPGSVVRLVNRGIKSLVFCLILIFEENVARAYSHLLFEMESLRKQLQSTQMSASSRLQAPFSTIKEIPAKNSYKNKRIVGDVQLRLRELRYEMDSISKILKSEMATTKKQLSEGMKVVKDAMKAVPNLSTRMVVNSKSNKLESQLNSVLEDLNTAKIVAQEYKKDVSAKGCRVSEADMRKVVEFAHKTSMTLADLAKDFTDLKEEKKKMWNTELESIMAEQKALQDQLVAFEDLETQAEAALKLSLEAESVRRQKKNQNDVKEIETLRVEEIDRYVREGLLASIRSVAVDSPSNHSDSLSKFEIIRNWKSKNL